MITYDVFWKTLKDRKISQYQLLNSYKVSRGLLYRMKKNESITTHTVNMLCDILECDVSDIMEYKSDRKMKNEGSNLEL